MYNSDMYLFLVCYVNCISLNDVGIAFLLNDFVNTICILFVHYFSAHCKFLIY